MIKSSDSLHRVSKLNNLIVDWIDECLWYYIGIRHVMLISVNNVYYGVVKVTCTQTLLVDLIRTHTSNRIRLLLQYAQ
jgi:hypothetical protein